MPNRIIKESIKYSEQIDSLSWFEEVMFYRLMVTVDDYGCYDGRPILLKNELFPTREDVTKKMIEAALKRLEALNLVQRYVVDGRPYIRLTTWEEHQRLRNKHRKFPEPPEIGDFDVCQSFDSNSRSNDGQMSATCQPESESEIESEIESESEIEKEKRASARDAVEASDLSEPMKGKIREWLEYKRERKEAYKPMGLKSLITQTIKAEQVHGTSAVIDAIDRAMSSGWKGMNFDLIRGKPPDKKDDVLLRIIQEGA